MSSNCLMLLSAQKLVFIFLTITSLLMLTTMVYLQVSLFNLVVPNSKLPWAEVYQSSYAIEIMYKITLFMGVVYSDQIELSYSLLGITVLLLCYKLFITYFRTFMFNSQVQLAYMVKDLTILHLAFMYLLTHIFKDPHYFYLVLSFLPIFVGTGLIMSKKIKEWAFIDKFNDLKSEKKTLISNLHLMRLLNQKKQDHLSEKLRQIQYSHYLACESYYQDLQIETMQGIQKVTELEQEAQPMGFDSTYLNKQESCEDIQKPLQEDMIDQNASEQDAPKVHIPLRSIKFSFQIEKFEEELKDDSENVSENIKGSGATPKFKSLQTNTIQPEYSRHSEMDLRSQDVLLNNDMNDQQNHLNQLYSSQDERLISRKQSKSTIKLVSHFFKHHLLSSKVKDFRLHLLKMYYTSEIIKNPALAHFQMFQFIENHQLDTLITRNQKLLHQIYIESLIFQGQSQLPSFSLDLQTMLDLNRLIGRFEQQSEFVTSKIRKFWLQFIQGKDSYDIFSKGIKISENLTRLYETYKSIVAKSDEQKEIKVFLQMAAFYKQVVFKTAEYNGEIEKSRAAFQTRKIGNDQRIRSQSAMKGLIIANLNLRKPMVINFMNKIASQITGYSVSKALGMKVNQIMPNVISDNHSKFIERFLKKGEGRMINASRNLFIKQKNGYIVPVTTYVQVNSLDMKQMVFTLEINTKLKPFEDVNFSSSFGTILLDDQFKITEFSYECQSICKLSFSLLKHIENEKGHCSSLSDIFKPVSPQDEITNEASLGKEMAVQLKQFDQQLMSFNSEQIEEEKVPTSNQSSTKELVETHNSGVSFSQTKRSQASMTNRQLFTMKILPMFFMNRTLNIFVVFVQRINDPFFTVSQNTMKSTIKNYFNKSLANGNPTFGPNDTDYNSILDKAPESEESQTMNREMSSVTSQSTNSSSNQSHSSKFSEYNQLMNPTNSTPKTLRFILQVVMFVFFIIISTSVVSLYLTLNNFGVAKFGLKVNEISLNRLLAVTHARISTRNIFDIQQGYAFKNNSIISDRMSFYTTFFKNSIEDLRKNQILFDSYGLPSIIGLEDVNLMLLKYSTAIEYEVRSVSQAVFDYANYGNQLVNMLETNTLGISGLIFIYIPVSDQVIARDFERIAYFLLENGNHNFYDQIRDYAKAYNIMTQRSIDQKVSFSSTMTWVCIAIICVGGLVIVPLFGRIQNRIITLMSIFFQIEQKIKEEMVTSINSYQDLYGKKQSVSLKQQMKLISAKATQQPPQANEDSLKRLQLELDKPQNQMVSSLEEIKLEDFDQDSSKPPKHKKHSKRHRHSPSQLPEAEEESSPDQQKIMQSKRQNEIIKAQMARFSRYISFRQVLQSVAIIVITIVFSAYFLAANIMNTNSFSTMAESINLMSIIFQRTSAVENSMHAVQETYFWNLTIFVNGGIDEMFAYYQDQGLFIEQQFKTLVEKNNPVYLEEAMPFINLMESGQFCEAFFVNDSYLVPPNVANSTAKACETDFDGINKVGITNLYNKIYQDMQEEDFLYIEVDKQFGKTLDFLVGQINGTMEKLIDVVQKDVQGPQKYLNQLTVQSLTNFFDKQVFNYVLFFSMFIFLTALFLMIFILHIFRKMRTEMILSNKLLYIINFEALEEEKRLAITKFLAKY